MSLTGNGHGLEERMRLRIASSVSRREEIGVGSAQGEDRYALQALEQGPEHGERSLDVDALERLHEVRVV